MTYAITRMGKHTVGWFDIWLINSTE